MIKIYNSKDERFRKKPINLCQRKEFGCKLFRFKKKKKKKIKREKRFARIIQEKNESILSLKKYAAKEKVMWETKTLGCIGVSLLYRPRWLPSSRGESEEEKKRGAEEEGLQEPRNPNEIQPIRKQFSPRLGRSTKTSWPLERRGEREREGKKKGLKKHRWKKLGHERELIFQTNVTDRSNLHLTGNTGVNFDGLSPLVSIPPLHPRAIFHPPPPRNVTLIFSRSCETPETASWREFFSLLV